MNTLLALLCLLLFFGFIAMWGRLVLLQRSIPQLVEEGNEAAIKEFRKRSARTRVGTTVEQMVPFVAELPYDPTDMRILSGGPVDYVVFDGLCDGEVRELVFLDIKTGKAKVNSAQRQVRRCAELGLVRFATFDVAADGEMKFKPSERLDELTG